jgi:hypothetical protein
VDKLCLKSYELGVHRTCANVDKYGASVNEPKEFQGVTRTRLVWMVQRNRELAEQARVQCERAQAEREAWKRRCQRAEGDVMAVDDVLAECLGVRLLAPGTLELLRRKLGQVTEAVAVLRASERNPNEMLEEVLDILTQEGGP